MNCTRSANDEELVEEAKMDRGEYEGKRISEYLL
jgi:hypothetical protein